jgi:hypothetical protein
MLPIKYWLLHDGRPLMGTMFCMTTIGETFSLLESSSAIKQLARPSCPWYIFGTKVEDAKDLAILWAISNPSRENTLRSSLSSRVASAEVIRKVRWNRDQWSMVQRWRVRVGKIAAHD